MFTSTAKRVPLTPYATTATLEPHGSIHSTDRSANAPRPSTENLGFEFPLLPPYFPLSHTYAFAAFFDTSDSIKNLARGRRFYYTLHTTDLAALPFATEESKLTDKYADTHICIDPNGALNTCNCA